MTDPRDRPDPSEHETHDTDAAQPGQAGESGPQGPDEARPTLENHGFSEEDLDALVEEREDPSPDEPAVPDHARPGDTAGQLGFFERMSWPSDAFTPNEEVVRSANPSAWLVAANYVGGLTFLTLGLTLAVLHLTGRTTSFINGFLPSLLELSQMPSWWPQVIGLVTLFGLTVTVGGHVTRKFTWYILTENRIIVRKGIFSRTLNTVKYTQVEKVEQEDPFPLRLAGVGNLGVYTAGTDEIEVEIPVVNHPSMLRTEIAKRIPDRTRRRQQPQPDPAPGHPSR